MRYVVATDGSGDFTALQAAVDAAAPGDEILVKPGIYRERVVVHRDGLRITGEDGAVLTGSGCAKDQYPDGRDKGTFLSATLLALGSDLTVENLTVRNDAGDGRQVGQAVAVYAAGDRELWKNCRFIAHQDTLFCGPVMPKVLDEIAPRTLDTVTCVPSTGDCPPTHERQCFVNCHIQGDVDFIFGPYRCWFERCTLFMNQRGGWYTAANTPEAQPWGLVFHRCRLTGECESGAASLGRPWRPYARTLFLTCEMDAHVNPAGFEDWQNWDGMRPVTRRCGEWGTTGARADLTTRHPGQAILTDAEAALVTPDAVLEGWQPGGWDGL